MRKFLLRIAGAFLLALICVAGAGAADDSQSYIKLIPKRFTGTLVSVAGDTVTLSGKDGKTFVVMMNPGWTVSVNRAGDVSSIKPGDFIGTTNVPVDASTGRATELRISEPGYRLEWGTHPYSPTSPNMMTHGTVASVSKTDAGVVLEVNYPNGSRNIIIPPGVTITISDPVARTTLKPGMTVSGVTRPDAQGVPRASRLQPSEQTHH